LREERRLRVFENMMRRRIFGPKRDEARGKWRKLNNEVLYRSHIIDMFCVLLFVVYIYIVVLMLHAVLFNYFS
jgi:hypothetical protein